MIRYVRTRVLTPAQLVLSFSRIPLLARIMTSTTALAPERQLSDEALDFGKKGTERVSKVVDDFVIFIARGNVVDLAGMNAL